MDQAPVGTRVVLLEQGRRDQIVSVCFSQHNGVKTKNSERLRHEKTEKSADWMSANHFIYLLYVY